VVLALTVWALFTFTGGVSQGLSVGLLAGASDLGRFFVAILIPGLWANYVFSYTGKGRELTGRRLAVLGGLVVPPAGVILFFLTTAREPAAVGAFVVVAILEVLLIAGLVVYSTYRFVSHGWGHPRIPTAQLVLVWVGVGAPYLASPIDVPEIRSVTVGFIVSGFCLAVAVDRYPVMTTLPEADYVTRTRVIEALQEVVVVLDMDDHIIDVNEAAAQTFGQSPKSMIGKPVSVVAEELSERNLSARATGNVTLQTANGRRQFRFSVSIVKEATSAANSEITPVARTVLLRDVTDVQTKEQRLSVLNRLLRHNVRNKLDVIMAHAEAVEDEHHQTIRGTAKELADQTQKVRSAEESMSNLTEPTSVDLTTVVRDIVQTYRQEYPDSNMSISAPDEVVVTTHKTVFTRILEELVDNAVTHNDASDPQVAVTVEKAATETVALSVADNGPGIPDREQQILTEEGETQSKHSLGVGLWFVKWAVQRLGGELELNENNPSGTVVTVRLYQLD
jgi:PAS domain S-box-containing protein